MAKFFELSEENTKLVEKKFNETGLFNYIDLKILGTTKSKEVVKVSKTSAIAEKLGNCPDSIICVVYEEAFDRLDDNSKELLLEDALSTVSYDTEKEKIIVGSPQIVVTLNGRAKYGDELVNAAEAAVMAVLQIQDEKSSKGE